jgi:hypothetical protein
LAEDTILADDLLRQLMNVGEVDLIVGISSHAHGQPTRRTFQVIEQAFQRHFTRQRAAILNVCATQSANGEPDKLDETDPLLFEKGASRFPGLRTIHNVTADFTVPPSPGTALRTVLTATDLLRARACAIVSAETSNLTPEWIAALLSPVYQEKFDFAAPLYTRHKFHGLLARYLLYPMARAVFGCRIRELYADEWGFSGRLASSCLNQNVWQEDPIQSRPEAWMAITALSSDLSCCQAYVGHKLQPAPSAAPDIVDVFRQTVGNLFWCIETCQTSWLKTDHPPELRTFGTPPDAPVENIDLNLPRLLELFRNGLKDLEPILGSILDPETHAELNRTVRLEDGKFKFSTDLWVRTLYDFLASYHNSIMNRDHLVQALVPLYRGMIFSVLTEHSNSSAAEMESFNESVCAEFERQRPYLSDKWNAKVEVKS